jgi:hypothetical protein
LPAPDTGGAGQHASRGPTRYPSGAPAHGSNQGAAVTRYRTSSRCRNQVACPSASKDQVNGTVKPGPTRSSLESRQGADEGRDLALDVDEDLLGGDFQANAVHDHRRHWQGAQGPGLVSTRRVVRSRSRPSRRADQDGRPQEGCGGRQMTGTTGGPRLACLGQRARVSWDLPSADRP